MIKYIAAIPDDSGFYKIDEWESDMSGYGGSTSTEYTYDIVKDINEATLFDSEKDLNHIMRRYHESYWNKHKILQVEEIVTRIIKE